MQHAQHDNKVEQNAILLTGCLYLLICLSIQGGAVDEKKNYS